MQYRFEDLTKEQLIAELNVATEKLKYYRTIEDHARAGIQLSPQELSARLAIAEANLAARQQELVLVYEKNKHLIDRLDQFEEQEKKCEFERRLAEATDFLKANGYEVRLMTAAERFPVEITWNQKEGIYKVCKEWLRGYNNPHAAALEMITELMEEIRKP